MNTDIEITLQDWRQGDLLDAAESFFATFEHRFSRFLADSELSQLNANAGQPCHVSADMIALLSEAGRLHIKTGGVFDPAVLAALEAAGYDRTFEAVGCDASSSPARMINRVLPFSDIAIDRRACTVRLPADVRIDLGGIGKGFAVDRVAEMLRGAGPVLISAGGDLFGRGDGPYGDGWIVAVTSPNRKEVDRVILHDEAVATSTVALRRWKRGGRDMHHLIDPRTAQPAANGLTSVTVIAQTATQADVFAKTALILGIDEGPSFVKQQDAHALFVLNDGSLIATDQWPGSTGR
jgi:thiamine biosynthesis lipoprotein